MAMQVPEDYGPREKAVPGDRIRQHVSAGQYNYTLAGAELAQHTARDTRGNVPETNIGNEPDIADVLNDTETDLVRGDIIALDAPLITPGGRLESWWSHRDYRGILPLAVPQLQHFGRIGVLWDPIPAGKMGRVVVSGVAHARLKILDSNHEYADVDAINGGKRLTTTDAGSACCQIIEVEATTAAGGTCGAGSDERWAKVRIQNGGAFTFVGRVTIAMAPFTCAPGGSGGSGGGSFCPPRGKVQVFVLHPGTGCLNPLYDRAGALVYICPYNQECRPIPVDEWVRIHCDRYFTWWATPQEPVFAMLRATECIQPGSVGSTATVQRQGSAGYEDDPAYTAPVLVDNTDCLVFALPGELIPARRDACCTANWIPTAPYGLTRRVRIDECIDCDTSGTATVLQSTCGGSGSEGCGTEDADCDITVCNTTGRPIAPCGPEEAVAQLTPGTDDGADCCWYLQAGPYPTRATATLGGKLCPDDDSASVTDVTFPTFCGEWEEPTTANNPYGLAGCEGADVELAPKFTGCTCEWDIIQVKPHVVENVMVDTRINCATSASCTLDRKVIQDVLVWSCDDTVCSDTPVWDVGRSTGSIVTFVSAIDCQTGGSGETCGGGLNVTTASGCVWCAGAPSTSQIMTSQELTFVEGFESSGGSGGSGGDCTGGSLSANKKTMCVLVCGNSSPTTSSETVLSLVPTSVVTYLYDDGTCLQADVATVLVVGLCDETTEEIFCTTDCESGSGT